MHICLEIMLTTAQHALAATYTKMRIITCLYVLGTWRNGIKNITAVCQITSCTIGCLSYGSNNVKIKTNIEIFEHVHRYITETKRFRTKYQIYDHLLACAWRYFCLEDALVRAKLNSKFTMIDQQCKIKQTEKNISSRAQPILKQEPTYITLYVFHVYIVSAGTFH